MNTINPTNPKKPGGFTLLEILIAIFIFAAVLSTLYTSYTGSFRNMETTESQADIYQMARIALERMVEDLESVVQPQRTENSNSEPEKDTLEPTPFVGEDSEINGRSADTLRFPSTAHLIFNEMDEDVGTAEIFYYVRENEEDGRFVLYRSDTPEFERSPEAEAGGLVLCDNLYAVNFTYYSDNGDDHESWDSTNDELEDELPVLVSILLEFVNRSDPETPLKFMTAVALPVARNAYEEVS